MTKLESLYQTSGEAEYISDIPVKNNEVFCALTIANELGNFERIDTSEAMVEFNKILKKSFLSFNCFLVS